MRILFETKISQVPPFKAGLIQSDGYFLADTTSNCFWASSLPSSITAKDNPQSWPDMNKLGSMMMELYHRILDKRQTK